jgi:hypothetical protein
MKESSFFCLIYVFLRRVNSHRSCAGVRYGRYGRCGWCGRVVWLACSACSGYVAVLHWQDRNNSGKGVESSELFKLFEMCFEPALKLLNIVPAQ